MSSQAHASASLQALSPVHPAWTACHERWEGPVCCPRCLACTLCTCLQWQIYCPWQTSGPMHPETWSGVSIVWSKTGTMLQLQTCFSSSPRRLRTASNKSVGLKPCSSLVRVRRNASSWASAKTARVLSQRMGYDFLEHDEKISWLTGCVVMALAYDTFSYFFMFGGK